MCRPAPWPRVASRPRRGERANSAAIRPARWLAKAPSPTGLVAHTPPLPSLPRPPAGHRSRHALVIVYGGRLVRLAVPHQVQKMSHQPPLQVCEIRSRTFSGIGLRLPLRISAAPPASASESVSAGRRPAGVRHRRHGPVPAFPPLAPITAALAGPWTEP